MHKVRLKTWDQVCNAAPKLEVNAARSYFKIYYPPTGLRFGAVRKFYISYFGKDVYVQKRMRYGKPFLPDEFSVHTEKGVWLMNIHESWISIWYGEEITFGSAPLPEVGLPEVLRANHRPAGVTMRVVSEPVLILEEPKPKILPKPDFSHITFDNLFEV